MEQQIKITQTSNADMNIGVMNTTEQSIQDIQKLAEQTWEGCHGCDDMDKYMWTGGFVTGYLMAKSE